MEESSGVPFHPPDPFLVNGSGENIKKRIQGYNQLEEHL